jgi:diguanylate cyclase (GGDEF)-like protein/PAS domain S-box-containing protein
MDEDIARTTGRGNRLDPETHNPRKRAGQRRDSGAAALGGVNYHSFFENSVVGFYISSPDGVFLEANQAMADILGFESPSELVSFYTDLRTQLYVDPEKRHEFLAELQRCGYVKNMEYRVVRRDGAYIWILTNARAVRDESGRTLYFEGSYQDITERRRVERAHRLNEARLEALNTLLQMKDSSLEEIADFALESAVTLTESEIGYLAFMDREETTLTMHSWSRRAMRKCRIPGQSVHFSVEETGLWGEAVRQRRAVITNDLDAAGVERKGFPEGHVAVRRHMNTPVMDGGRIVLVAGVGNKEEEYEDSDLRQLTLLMQGMWDLVRRKQAEKSLEQKNRELETFVNNIPHMAWLKDEDSNFLLANRAFGDAVGMDPEYLRSNTCAVCFGRDVAEEMKKDDRRVMEEKRPITVEETVTDKDGRELCLETSKSPILDSKGNVTGTVGVGVDITDRKRAEERLRQSEEKFRKSFQANPDPVFLLTADGLYSDVNDSAIRTLGYDRERIVGRKLDLSPFLTGESSRIVAQNFELRKQGADIKPYTIELRTRSGESLFAEINVGTFEEEGRFAGELVVARDVTERRRFEEKLRYFSFHDSLTGLYNRNFFEEEMRRLQDGRFAPMGIIVCDVDGLKLINDTMGHERGDALLAGTAEVLRRTFRESDVVARIGGDEFAVLVTGVGPQEMESAANRLRNAVQASDALDPAPGLSISVGYAVSEEHKVDIQDLFRQADNAMYREKLNRAQSIHGYIVQALMKALEARDFITEGHCERLESVVVRLAKAMRLPESAINDLTLLAKFHDLGKVGISDQILFKPGKLSPEEARAMRKHCEIGHRIAQTIPSLAHISDWILKHHEWWDGRGYPLGLKGENIPLVCRILAVADAFEAMTSDRPYRKAMSHAETMEELRRNAGTQFDPDVVEQFMRVFNNTP